MLKQTLVAAAVMLTGVAHAETTRYDPPIRVTTTFPVFDGSHAIYGCTVTGDTATDLDSGEGIPLIQVHTRLGKKIDGRPHEQREYQNVPSVNACDVDTDELLELLEHHDPIAWQNAEEDGPVHVLSHSYNHWGENFGYRIEIYDNNKNHVFGGDDTVEILDQISQQHLVVDRNAVAAQLDRELERVDYYHKVQVHSGSNGRWISGIGYIIEFKKGKRHFYVLGQNVDHFIERLDINGNSEGHVDEELIRPQIERELQRIRYYAGL